MVSAELIYTHRQDQVENLALHRSKYTDLSDDEWRFFLQQIEGYQRTRDKLPTFAASLNSKLSTLNSPWWYPPRLSCEQCSSEATARYKASLVTPPSPLSKGDEKNRHLIDLTGGAGVDTFFFAKNFSSVNFVEKDANLCFLAKHNLPNNVAIHNTTAEEFLSKLSTLNSKLTIIYIDPARRDKNGGKVFRLADCTPNVVALLPKMREVADRILIKLSPMLDITQALQELGGEWQVHVVAVKNEVKEVLLMTPPTPLNKGDVVIATDVAEGWRFEFTREEEDKTISQFANYPINQGYIYEPSVAILKAGAYKLVGARYGLRKLDVNTHLYVSDQLVGDFPGRIFRIRPTSILPHREEGVRGGQFNVLTRNYVMGAEELKKKLKVKDGGTHYIIGTRVNGKPTLLMAEKL